MHVAPAPAPTRLLLLPDILAAVLNKRALLLILVLFQVSGSVVLALTPCCSYSVSFDPGTSKTSGIWQMQQACMLLLLQLCPTCIGSATLRA